jgi:Tol biopolymer transport system component
MLAAGLLGMLFAAVSTPAPAAPVVAPAPFGLLSPGDMSNTLGAAFTGDGKTVYYMKSEPGGVGLTIFQSHLDSGRWSAPQVAPFSGRYADADPAIVPDGSALIFSSKRPPRPDAFSLYELFLIGPKSGTIVPLPNSANALGDEYYASVSADGSLYFTLGTDAGYQIFHVPAVSEENLAAQPLMLAGDAKGVSDFDETIAANGKYMVFASDRPGGAGASDIYLSVRRGNRWCSPFHLPAPINKTAEMGTGLSRDGRTLYFASYRTLFAFPAAKPMTADDFQALLEHPENNALHTYVADIGPVVDRRLAASDC